MWYLLLLCNYSDFWLSILIFLTCVCICIRLVSRKSLQRDISAQLPTDSDIPLGSIRATPHTTIHVVSRTSRYSVPILQKFTLLFQRQDMITWDDSNADSHNALHGVKNNMLASDAVWQGLINQSLSTLVLIQILKSRHGSIYKSCLQCFSCDFDGLRYSVLAILVDSSWSFSLLA